MSFSGKKVFITTADTRIGRVLGKTFADAGCSVYGLRTCRNELDFAVESYFADYVMHNQAAVDALLSADVVVIPLQGAEVKVKATLTLLESNPSETPRAVIAVSSVSTWANTPMNADGAPLTERDETRRGVAPGAAKAMADAERLVLRASSSSSMLRTFVVCPGLLYGAGEFPDGFLAPMRAAWEGKPVPVFGNGNNRLPVCHAMNLAATVVAVAAEATTSSSSSSSSAAGRYVLAVDAADDGFVGGGKDGGGGGKGGEEQQGSSSYAHAAPTQKEVAAAIARAFDVGMVQLPATAAATAANVFPGAENLLVDMRIAATEPFASDVTPFHRGGFGAPVTDPDNEGAESDSEDGDPPLVGGMPAVMSQFLEANNLTPLRVVVRGPPLSFADELAATAAESYALPLLTPATLMTEWVTKMPEELREKCGGGVEVDGKGDREAEHAAAQEKYDALDDDVKLELITAVCAERTVKMTGYVMAAGLPPVDPEALKSLFTHIPPKPPKKKKRKMKKKTDGAEDGASDDDDEDDEEEEEEEKEEEEETEEAAEARRCLNPAAAPTTVISLEIKDEGQYAKKFKKSHPEEYEKYREWAKAEEAAYEEAYAAAEAAKEKDGEGGRDASDDVEYDDDGNEIPKKPKRKSTVVVVTDPVIKYLVSSKMGVKKSAIDASGSVFSRLRAAKRALGDPHNFSGWTNEDDDDAVDAKEEAAKKAAEAAAIAADDAARQAKKDRAAALVARQQAEVEKREADSLHVRSASLRQYLAEEVMPTVTEAMLKMLKIRPEDPVHALSEYLMRKDKESAMEEEVNRVSTSVMDLALLEEVKAAERAEKLEISQRKAREALLTIGTPRKVSFVPAVPEAEVLTVDPEATEAATAAEEGGGGEEGEAAAAK